MITNMNNVIRRLKNISLNMEETLNPVNIKGMNRCEVQIISPLHRIGKKVRKVNKKIRFIHETYANLTFVHDVLNHVSKVLGNDGSDNRSLQTAMCTLHQANRKLQCKGRNKKNKPIKTFQRTRVCGKKKRFRKTKRNCFKRDEFEDLSKIKAAENILQGTLDFWNSCVYERKGRFGLKRKCRNKIFRYSKKKGKRNKKKNKRTKKIHKKVTGLKESKRLLKEDNKN
ncbi:uncharacterized protein LOC134232193 [Saccostrea cucullata]|uniref:uncharacterized protein LOC134232193 n=1 Tax=Saccostrea cuccullata TaxID=36930 RepID=UPI002ED5D67C